MIIPEIVRQLCFHTSKSQDLNIHDLVLSKEVSYLIFNSLPIRYHEGSEGEQRYISTLSYHRP
jgi:hypothetical protein